jgi:methylated-DNA-protein-cysteine methyltransferase-like protein
MKAKHNQMAQLRKTLMQDSIKMTPFTRSVMAWIKKIPRGKVATYGQIARLAGKPGSARAVGWILNSCSETHGLPWQRVLNSQGKISFPKKSSLFSEQKRLLEKEGVELYKGALDLERYGWKKEPTKKRGAPSMFT